MNRQEEDQESFQEEYGFELQEAIGEGSFGTVYEALHQKTQRSLAVKVIPKHLLRNTKIEQNIMSGLKHPNIVRFLQVIETKLNVFLVMELVKQGSLAGFIRDRKKTDEPFDDVEASTIMRSILRAVDYIHGQQIIHRDLKPENILVANREDLNSIKVADFGLSFQFSQENGNYQKLLVQRCGTFIFMAPEQLYNNQYSKPVDIWSCGVIMYMIFSMGKHPLAKPHETRETYVQNLKQTWPLIPNMTDMAQDFMRRLTCINPLERYSAGQALVHPWITRRFEDEVPMNYQERILMFEKQIHFSQRLKFIYFLRYLQKFLEKTHKKVNVTSYLVYKSVGATTTDYSQEKSYESNEKKRYSNTQDTAIKLPQSGPIKLLQQQQRRRTIQLDRNVAKIIKNHLGTDFTQPSSLSSSPHQSPKKIIKNFQIRVKEIPEIQEGSTHKRGQSLSQSQVVSAMKIATMGDQSTYKGKSTSLHYSPEKEKAYLAKTRGQSPKVVKPAQKTGSERQFVVVTNTPRLNLPPIYGSFKRI